MPNNIKKHILVLFTSSILLCSIGVNIGLLEKLVHNIEHTKTLENKSKASESQIKSLNKQITDKDADIKELNNVINTQNELLLDKDKRIKELEDNIEESSESASQSRMMRTISTNWNFTDEEIDLLNRLVEAEAGNEPYDGQLAVANVVLNRIKDSRYPNTLKGVIYQKHQYESVAKGMLWDRPTGDDVKRAVQEAINGNNNIGNCISFWADYIRKDHPLWDLKIKYKIGTHVFTDEY